MLVVAFELVAENSPEFVVNNSILNLSFPQLELGKRGLLGGGLQVYYWILDLRGLERYRVYDLCGLWELLSGLWLLRRVVFLHIQIAICWRLSLTC